MSVHQSLECVSAYVKWENSSRGGWLIGRLEECGYGLFVKMGYNEGELVMLFELKTLYLQNFFIKNSC